MTTLCLPAMPPLPTTPLRVMSSDGDLLIDRRTGAVIHTEDVRADHEYGRILRFDLSEWHRALAAADQLDRATFDDVDILHVGYWYRADDGREAYEPASTEYRAECFTRRMTRA